MPDQAQARRGGAAMSLQDFTARRERQMLAADVDGDGRVSKAEFVAGTKSAKGDPARRFAQLDRNGDGAIDRQEIAAMTARRFARLDGDRDGSLTREERAVARTATPTDAVEPGDDKS